MSTVPPPPEDEEDVLHRREAADTPVSIILLGFTFLRGGAPIVLLEHVALLEGVVDWGLVVLAWLLQHVVEHAGTSRGRSKDLAGWVDCEGLVLVVVAPLRTCIMAGFLALLAPLVLLLRLLGLAALRGRVVHTLALLVVEDGPTASSPEAKLVAMPNSLLELTGRLRPSSRTRSRQVVPSKKACTISY
jgi:hypothetical protein